MLNSSYTTLTLGLDEETVVLEHASRYGRETSRLDKKRRGQRQTTRRGRVGRRAWRKRDRQTEVNRNKPASRDKRNGEGTRSIDRGKARDICGTRHFSLDNA